MSATTLPGLRTQQVAGQSVVRRRRLEPGNPIKFGAVLGPVLLLAIWSIGSATGWLDPRVLSAPWTVVTTAGDLIADGRLQSNLWTSTQRAFIGLGFGIVLGVVLALISGLSRLGEAILDAGALYDALLPVDRYASHAPFDYPGVPKDPGDYTGLIILGGPMSANDVAKYPFLAETESLIRRFDAESRPVLGICLGAQIIARAFGAGTVPGPWLGTILAGEADIVLGGLWVPAMYAGRGRTLVSVGQVNARFSTRFNVFDHNDPAAKTAVFEEMEREEEATERMSVDMGLPFKEAKQAVDLSQAERIVAVGRGIKGQEHMAVAEALAKALGAEVAASRPICDAGWLPMDRQIGSSGQTVAPKLYVALGISGAIQHLVGMKGARTIVAINKDAEAPIFEVADYGVQGDLFEIAPAIVAELERG